MKSRKEIPNKLNDKLRKLNKDILKYHEYLKAAPQFVKADLKANLEALSKKKSELQDILAQFRGATDIVYKDLQTKVTLAWEDLNLIHEGVADRFESIKQQEKNK